MGRKILSISIIYFVLVKSMSYGFEFFCADGRPDLIDRVGETLIHKLEQGRVRQSPHHARCCQQIDLATILLEGESHTTLGLMLGLAQINISDWDLDTIGQREHRCLSCYSIGDLQMDASSFFSRLVDQIMSHIVTWAGVTSFEDESARSRVLLWISLSNLREVLQRESGLPIFEGDSSSVLIDEQMNSLLRPRRCLLTLHHLCIFFLLHLIKIDLERIQSIGALVFEQVQIVLCHVGC